MKILYNVGDCHISQVTQALLILSPNKQIK